MSETRPHAAAWQQALAALLAYALLSVFITWPLLADLGGQVPGKLGDAYAHLWTFDWVTSALLAGKSIYFTDRLYYPVGANLLNHNIAWLHIAAWLPLQGVLGAETAYTLVYWLAIPLNGLALYLLAREHGLIPGAAFIAGLVAAFWPHILSHFDHPNLILICWLPLAMIFLRRTFYRQHLSDALLAGLFVALLGITRWQLLLLSAPLLALYLLYLLWQRRAFRPWRSVGLLVLSAVVALLLMAPLLLPLLDYQFGRDVAADILVEEEAYGSDLLAYLVPGRYHPLWGQQVAVATRPFAGNNVYTRSVGYAVLILAALAVFKRPRESAFWLAAALVYVLLALGPELTVAGRPVVALPYRWLEQLFLAQLVRFPDRFNVILSVPAALLAGMGSGILLAGITRRQALGRGALIATIILFEYLTQFAMLPAHTPAWYGRIAGSGAGAIVDIPAHVETFDTYFNYYQLTHRRPLVIGHVSRPSREMFAFIDSNEFLSSIYGRRDPPDELAAVQTQLNSLVEAGIEYVVIHRDMLDQEQVDAWRAWFAGSPIFEDEETLVYGTAARTPGDDLPWTAELLAEPGTGTALGLIGSDSVPESVAAGGSLELDAVWGSTGPVTRDLAACLELVSVSGETAQESCLPLAPGYPTRQWPEGELVHVAHGLALSPYLPGGTYRLRMVLRENGRQAGEAVGEAVGQTADLGEVRVTALERSFETPPLARKLEARWGEELALLGYNQETSEDELQITLTWQALRRMAASYKIFVHVTDTATGELVAQHDGVPRDWSYPTNWWERNEVVSDAITVPLAGLPGGRYAVSVGVYDAETGQRLPLTRGGPAADSDVLPLDSFELPGP
ncbi:MAG: hypothetical protein ACK2UK_00080 [Candidatus Promineifilaceae bacterium]